MTLHRQSAFTIRRREAEVRSGNVLGLEPEADRVLWLHVRVLLAKFSMGVNPSCSHLKAPLNSDVIRRSKESSKHLTIAAAAARARWPHGQPE